ncbi:MAG: hypothetical protein CMH38_12565 [Microbacterium sp.]|nr:hypothetical protein [Microbacterium sp.]HAS31567.1 hypothetical protein [Microbacterium sp.]
MIVDAKEAVMGQSASPLDAREPERLFYSEEETAALLGIHRTTLRTLALEGQAPVEPIRLTRHKRVYRRIDVQRLAGLEQ